MLKNDNKLIEKVIKSISEEGISGCARRTKNFARKMIKAKRPLETSYKDILFISGCNEALPHPWRYRVSHQREQLEAYHFSTDEVYYLDIDIEQIRFYRAFVFFRCPYTGAIGEFVSVAKGLNKRLIYDIDDLVIDTKYTDLIPFVRNMNVKDKQAYDENVNNMQRLLKKCDMAITTTNCLAEELRLYIPQVYVNRNTASEEMVKLSREVIVPQNVHRADRVRIGYFSGSITHNADFEFILPVITKILDKYNQVELSVVGELDLPEELEKYRDRICQLPFCDWRRLPEMIAGVDINLAPLENTIFNRAKSENKWVEAALVRVVTVASDVGAFHDCIQNGETGVLCTTEREWQEALERLVLDSGYREELAEKAFCHCVDECSSIKAGAGIAKIFREKVEDNFVFVLPGLEISGGIKVALKHASILQKNGKDVMIFLLDGGNGWYEFDNSNFPCVCLKDSNIFGRIGCAVATMWTTVAFVEQYPDIGRRCYLVQNFETDFYSEGNPLRIEANKTYMPHNGVEFLTISKWCYKWLKEGYEHTALYAPNGLETEHFSCHERKIGTKVRILIEGDCAVEYKNVDEAFKVVNILEPELYEVWYMSYNAEPKDWYRVDKFLHKVPYEKVAQIYGECDILLKTSLLESFSYPPLEMMATGGYVVAVPNGGNEEYLQNEYNCLFYRAGDIKQAKSQIERICGDRMLQSELFENGRRTAQLRNWSNVEAEILDLYVPKVVKINV